MTVSGHTVSLLRDFEQTNGVASVDVRSDADASLLLRYQNADNYLAAVYSPADRTVYLTERKNGKTSPALSGIAVPAAGSIIRLTAEVRDNAAAAAVIDGDRTYTTAIMTVTGFTSGAVGLMHENPTATQAFSNFELRRSPVLARDDQLTKELYDARGIYRGKMIGSGFADRPIEWRFGWDDFGKYKHILLGAYRPERPPAAGDWVVVLENNHAMSDMHRKGYLPRPGS